MPEWSVLAIDVGSSCVKLGWFPAGGACAVEKSGERLPIATPPLPAPQEAFQTQHKGRSPAAWLAEIEDWIASLPPTAEMACALASVHAAAAGSLEESLGPHQWHRFTRVTAIDVPLTIRTAEPQRVGVDRLLGALAVNRLRPGGVPAISVDMGTAITVDLIASDGAFEGGAILAGPMLSLAALHGGTASLPRLDAAVLTEPRTAVGKSTSQAMAAGAYWGAVGAVRELVGRMAGACATEPEVFLTGGAAAVFADKIGLGDRPARHVPHLVLAGIRIAADRMTATLP
jgi:type III pantothenate kinase